MNALVEHQLYGQLPSAQGLTRPGFWTRRRKTAASLLTVLALIAGVAVAFKLFDRTVGNNVVRDAATFNFDILKREPGIDAGFLAAPPMRIFEQNGQLNQYPGDTRTVDVQIRNTNAPANDASFTVHVQNIQIRTATMSAVSPASPLGQRFLNGWTLDIDKELILVVDGAEASERSFNRFGPACAGNPSEFTAANPCDLGVVKAAGTDDVLGQPLDERFYKFSMIELDDGADQSVFKGWFLYFDLVFNARVPAVPDGPALVGER